MVQAAGRRGTRRHPIKRLVPQILIALCLGACAAPDATYRVDKDLSHALLEPQPVFVAADQPNYQTGVLLPLLRSQLAGQGYTVGADLPSATWVMELSVQDQMDSAQKVHSEVHLDLFPAAGFRAGTRQSAWHASAETDPQTLNAYAPAILQALLQPKRLGKGELTLP